MSTKSKWEKFLQWLTDSVLYPDGHEEHDSPFEYVTKTTEQLEIGDYVVAYVGYIQRIGEVEYDGSRLVVTKLGHRTAVEFQAYEGDKFTVRKIKEGK